MDLIDGACVRLAQGDYDRRTTYGRDPLDTALRFEAAGLRRLHMVDLDGARTQRPANLKVLERIAARTRLEIQYGGGIKSRTALCDVFSAGARRAVCGSVAVREPDCLAAWLAEFGGERLILGADLRDGRIAIAGWSEETPLGAAELIGRFRKQGLQQVICTDIAPRRNALRPRDIVLRRPRRRNFPDDGDHRQRRYRNARATSTALDRRGAAQRHRRQGALRRTYLVDPRQQPDKQLATIRNHLSQYNVSQTNNPLPGHPRRPRRSRASISLDLRECGRSGGARAPATPPKVPTSWSTSTSAPRPKVASTFTGLVSRIAGTHRHPVHRRRRASAYGRRRRSAARAPGPTRSASTAPPWRDPVAHRRRIAAKYGSPVRHRWPSTPEDDRRTAGASPPTAGAASPTASSSTWAEGGLRSAARAKSSSPRWTTTARRNGYPVRHLRAVVGTPARSPSSPRAARASVQHIADVLTLGTRRCGAGSQHLPLRRDSDPRAQTRTPCNATYSRSD